MSSISKLLLPSDEHSAINAHRRLIWSLFADSSERKRDFLWKLDGRGRFLVLSSRQPLDNHSLFSVESKKYEPRLSIGQRLEFSLRANIVITKWEDVNGTPRRKKHDVVMHRLSVLRASNTDKVEIPKRLVIATEESHAWLSKRGASSGFNIDKCVANKYKQHSFARPSNKDGTIGVVDLQGILTVDNPVEFLNQVAQGFGSARAFGCGLMLIKPA